jgi:hypothetical protein
MVAMISGCATLGFKPAKPIETVEGQAAVIYRVARNATYVGLVDDAEMASDLKKIVNEQFLPYLSDPNATISEITLDIFWAKLAADGYKMLLKDALDTFDEMFDKPSSARDFIGEDNHIRLLSLLNGIVFGCDVVITENIE